MKQIFQLGRKTLFSFGHKSTITALLYTFYATMTTKYTHLSSTSIQTSHRRGKKKKHLHPYAFPSLQLEEWPKRFSSSQQHQASSAFIIIKKRNEKKRRRKIAQFLFSFKEQNFSHIREFKTFESYFSNICRAPNNPWLGNSSSTLVSESRSMH